MKSAILLAAALAAAPAARAEGTPATANVTTPAAAKVTYVTPRRTYLDAGAEDGIAQGAELEIRRGGDVVGRCRVEAVAAHHAICTGAPARIGDVVPYRAAPAPPPPRLLPPPPPDEVLEARLRAVEALPIVPVRHEAKGAPVRVERRIGEVAFGWATWTSTGAGPSDVASVDVAIRGAPVGRWLALDVDARAERWLRQDAPRFRPEDESRLYVWQAQLSATPGAFTLGAGRVLPWNIPGATVFDGAMAGLRGTVAGARAEAGVFGGLVPQPDTTDPAGERSTGGAYWSLDRAARGAGFRHEGRVAVARSPELGTRGEASLAGRAFLRRLDVSAEAHLGAGGEVEAPGFVDAARLDAALRPLAGFVVGGGFRYAGLDWPQPFEPPAFPGRSRDADGFVAWDVTPGLRLRAAAGRSEDPSSGLDRSWYGPELVLPRVFPRLGLSFGYLEERGWLEGRSAFAQLVARPWPRFRALVRGSWARTTSLPADRDEVAVYASSQAEPWSRAGLRLWVSGRTAFDSGGLGGGGSPSAVTGAAAVYATF